MSDYQRKELTIDQALAYVSPERLVSCWFYVQEPTKGSDKPSRDIVLSFKVKGIGRKYYHRLWGYRLNDYLAEAESLHGSQPTVGISGFGPSDNKPNEYGRVETLFFPSELAKMGLITQNVAPLSPQPVYDANSGGEEFDHPF